MKEIKRENFQKLQVKIQELSRDGKHLLSIIEEKQFRDQISVDDLMITDKGMTILEPLQRPHLLTE